MQFSRSDEARAEGTPRRGLSKLNSVSHARESGIALGRVSVVHGSVDIPRTAGALKRKRALREELPRKEVIQPHLPVRLPCYDFTPITSPTFDGSLP